jgi:hypothetical protein
MVEAAGGFFIMRLAVPVALGVLQSIEPDVG